MMNKTQVRRLLGATVIGAALAAAAVGLSTPHAKADAFTNSDTIFLTTLNEQGITYVSPEFAISVGHAICVDRESGVSETREGVRMWGLFDIDAFDAGYYVGAAEAAYCPDME